MVKKTLKSNGIFLILPIVRDPSTSERERVQDSSFDSIILGQLYIMSSRMETRIFINGSTYARVKSLDDRETVQSCIVCPIMKGMRTILLEGMPHISRSNYLFELGSARLEPY